MPFIWSQYTPFGHTFIDDTPDRPDKTPEQFEAERRADRIGYRDLLSTLRWTKADFDRAQSCGFPKSLTTVERSLGQWEAIYSRKGIEEWRLKIAAIAKGLK